VASPVYLARHEPLRTPQDLLRHRCIRFRFASGALYPWDLERNGKSVSIDVQGPMTLDNTNLMLEAVLHGIGIAWLPDSLVTAHLAKERLVCVLPEWSQLFPGTYYPANAHPPTALRLFAQAVQDWASSTAEPAGCSNPKDRGCVGST
jgi:DNA-binding transcriptional LysR family regulator